MSRWPRRRISKATAAAGSASRQLRKPSRGGTRPCWRAMKRENFCIRGTNDSQCGAVGGRHLTAEYLGILEAERRSTRGQRYGGQGGVRIAEAVACKLQLPLHDRIEQVQQVCDRRHPEAGREFARHRGAADAFRALQHQHLASGARQVGGAHQPVVAGADDDSGQPLSHRSTHPAPLHRD